MPSEDRLKVFSRPCRTYAPAVRVPMIGFLDPPGPFAPKTQWQEFLACMFMRSQADPQVQAAVQDAQEMW